MVRETLRGAAVEHQRPSDSELNKFVWDEQDRERRDRERKPRFSWYSELLKDPRWQRKRLEIMERAGFKCEACGNGSDTLHVHHGYYEKNKKPWEYANDTLWCLCVGCHEIAEDHKQSVHLELARINPKNLWAAIDIINAFRQINSDRR